MIENTEIHNKIIKIIEKEGPSTPLKIAKELEMNSLFISAFLSELNEEKRIKMSHLKMGGTHLYLIDGQEPLLENFTKYLHPKEAEAQLKLKENQVLKDSEQHPAIRVALRSIRDFAIGFKKNEEIYWRYITLPEDEIKQILNKEVKISKQTPLEKSQKNEEKSTPEPKSTLEPKPPQNIEKPIKKIEPILKNSPKFENPLIVEEPKKEKPKSEFILKTIRFIKENYKLIQEKEYKSREYNCIIQIETPLGQMNFLTQAKDKKSITEKDIQKLLSESQKIPLPALMIYTGTLSKKAKDYAEVYFSALKTKKII